MRKRAGFSLIELMIVIAVVAILASIAFPALSDYVRKARRADMQQRLLDMASAQALWRSNNISYATTLNELYNDDPPPNIPYYDAPTISAVTPTTFNLSVDANGGQVNDNEGASCTPLSYVLNGTVVTKGPINACWE